MPVIGQFQISDIARVSFLLHEQWGKIVRLGGLLGRPDLLFVYDADEIEKVFEQNFEIVIMESIVSKLRAYSSRISIADGWFFPSKLSSIDAVPITILEHLDWGHH